MMQAAIKKKVFITLVQWKCIRIGYRAEWMSFADCNRGYPKFCIVGPILPAFIPNILFLLLDIEIGNWVELY